MARRNSGSTSTTPQTEAPAEVENTENTEENVVTTVTAEAEVQPEASTPEAPEAAPEAPEAAKAAKVAKVIDLTDFNAAVAVAVAGKDETTGVVAESFVATVQEAFRKLDGAKAKNAAKTALNEGMKAAMEARDLPSATAWFQLSNSLTAVKSAAKAERVPTDPTEAFVQRIVGLRLATDLAKGNVPEGVTEDWTTKANELYSASVEAAQASLAWANRAPVEEGVEDVPEPEASPFVKAAVKLSQGKSGKVGGKATTKGTGTPFLGVRRDISKHVAEAFADKDFGDFLTISEIKNSRSEEYGDNPPSAGAISARLFPKQGAKCTLTGVTPATSKDGKGNKGATKA